MFLRYCSNELNGHKNEGQSFDALPLILIFNWQRMNAGKLIFLHCYAFSEPKKSLDDCGQLHGKLVEIRNIQEGITVNTLNVLLYR